MSDIEEVASAAKSLEPADRLRLIARLWASLPSDHWAAPTSAERDRLRRHLTQVDVDLLDEVPWKIVERMTARYAAVAGTKIYSAPRRFDLATIFVVTSAFAILFGLMRALQGVLQFPPTASLYVAGFITLVAIGQAALFGGLRPRRASMLVGVTIFVVIFGGTWLFSARMMPGPWILTIVVQAVIYGVIFGYIAGVLVGGVFLVADYARQRFRRQPSPAPEIDHDAAEGG